MGVRGELRQKVADDIADLRSTIQEVVDGAEPREIITVFGIVPAILLGVEAVIRSDTWLLAQVHRSVFYLDLVDQPLLSVETLVETYLSTVAHADWRTHLRPNLQNYLICMSALYPVAILSRRKATIAKLYLFILVVAPLFVTVFSMLFPMGARSIGFSGVLSAYFGLLPVVLFAAVGSRIDAGLNPDWSVMVMFLVYASIFAYLGNGTMAVLMGVIVLLSFMAMVARVGVGGVGEAIRVVFEVEYPPFPWALAVAWFGAVGMYYQLPPGTNVVAHIGGYIFGFLAGFLVLGESLSFEELRSEYRGVAVRREGHKLVVSNVPEEWHQSLKIGGALLSVGELFIAIYGFYAAWTGDTFSLPLITLALAVLVFVELGRPDIEIEYQSSYTSPAMTLGPGGRANWHYDPPLELIRWEYLDDEGEPIPEDELGLYGSESVKIQIPNGNLKVMVESGEADFGLELPYPARQITLSGENEDYEFDNLGEDEERTIENPEELAESLTRDEATISFDIRRDELFSLGRIIQVDAADDSKSIELVSTEEYLEYRYSQDDYAHTVRVEKNDLHPGDWYDVILQWEPGGLRMHVGPTAPE